MVTRYAVHDLLRIESGIASNWTEAPAWVRPSLERAPWVVVRRERVLIGIAVGVRGADRSERFATIVDASAVCEKLTPGDLVARVRDVGRLDRAFHDVRRAASDCDLTLGPVGAFAFELASGKTSTTQRSDLDLLVSGDGVSRASLRDFLTACDGISKTFAVTPDVEVAFGNRAVALRELLSAEWVVAKTPWGPRIIACPV